MWRRVRTNVEWLLPAGAVGLFAGRLLGEWTRPGLPGAIALTLVTLIITAYALRRITRHPPPATRALWPLLIPLAYVLYPHSDPRAALAVATITLLTVLLANRQLPISNRAPHARKAAELATRHLPLATFFIFLTLYLATLAPDVLPADNGEFQGVAAQLGVAHPPGFALYTLLAHLMTRLPFGSPAVAVNVFSALAGAATVAVVTACVQKVTRSAPAGVLAAIALGTATTFWSQATTANVRSLTALFAALAVYLLLEIRARRVAGGKWQVASDSPPHPHTRSPLHLHTLFAFVLSLGIVHHASLAFMGLVFVAYFLLLVPNFLTAPRRWWRPALAALLGLLPLLYFPLRAGADVRGASPDLATPAGFLEHVLALGFRGDLFAFSGPAELWARLKVMGNVMTFQFHPLLLAGMGLGLLLLLWRDRKLALLLGGSFALHTLVTATYRAPQTVEYMLPAYVPAAICLGIAVGGSTSGLRRLEIGGWGRHLLTAVLLVVALGQGVRHYGSYARLHRDRTAREYAESVLDGAPAGAVVLADWHWATPLWYLQEVEGARPDVTVRYVFPTDEPYAVTWERRAAEEYGTGQPVVATHSHPGAYYDLPPPEPLGDAFLFRPTPRTTLPAGYEPTDFILGDTIRVLGYRLAPATVPIGHETTLTLAWQPTFPLRSPISLFAHVVGVDGTIYAQQDLPATPQTHVVAEPITLTQFRLTPRPGAMPGDFTIAIGAYETNSGTPLPDADGRPRTPLTTLAVTAMPQPLFTQDPTHRPLVDDDRTLIGFDWDTTLRDRPRLYLHWRTPAGYVTEVRDGAEATLPAYHGPWGLPMRNVEFGVRNGRFYVPLGEGIVWTGDPSLTNQQTIQPTNQLTLPQHFAASRPVLRDLIVSVRLVGYEEDGFHWAWWDLDDGVPALGAIPTLKWIDGSRVRDPHFLTVSEDARPGQEIGGILRLYDAFTSRPVPILDERITQDYLGIPLGAATVGPVNFGEE